MKLGKPQIEEFDKTGVLRLPGAIARSDAEAMCARLWHALERGYGVRRDEPETWRAGPVHGLQAPGRAGAFSAAASPALCAALDRIFAPDDWTRPPRWGQPLVTFPEDGDWDMPCRSWHLDSGASDVTRPPDNVIVFAFLDALPGRNGGTVAVTGSHRLIRKLAASAAAPSGIRSADAGKLLASTHPWLSDLWSRDRTSADISRFMEDGATVSDVSLKVVELTGMQGDVMIMHPCVLHAAAKNCGSQPRLVLRQDIHRAMGPG
jgi:hypothetical protein